MTVAPTGSTNLVMRRSTPRPSSRQRKVMGRVAELGEESTGMWQRWGTLGDMEGPGEDWSKRRWVEVWQGERGARGVQREPSIGDPD